MPKMSMGPSMRFIKQSQGDKVNCTAGYNGGQNPAQNLISILNILHHLKINFNLRLDWLTSRKL